MEEAKGRLSVESERLGEGRRKEEDVEEDGMRGRQRAGREPRTLSAFTPLRSPKPPAPTVGRLKVVLL